MTVTTHDPALRGDPAPTNVSGFGAQMMGGMPYKPRDNGGSYATRMERRRLEELAHTQCAIPRKQDGGQCLMPLTVSGFCAGHTKTVGFPLMRFLRSGWMTT